MDFRTMIDASCVGKDKVGHLHWLMLTRIHEDNTVIINAAQNEPNKRIDKKMKKAAKKLRKDISATILAEIHCYNAKELKMQLISYFEDKKIKGDGRFDVSDEEILEAFRNIEATVQYEDIINSWPLDNAIREITRIRKHSICIAGKVFGYAELTKGEDLDEGLRRIVVVPDCEIMVRNNDKITLNKKKYMIVETHKIPKRNSQKYDWYILYVRED